MAEKDTKPQARACIHWYYLAVHNKTCEYTFEYLGSEKQSAEQVGFRHLLHSFFFFLI